MKIIMFLAVGALLGYAAAWGASACSRPSGHVAASRACPDGTTCRGGVDVAALLLAADPTPAEPAAPPTQWATP